MTSLRRLRLLSTILASLPFLSGCDFLGPSGDEGPGILEMELASLHNLEGAAVFELVGGEGLGEVTSEVGDAYWRHRGDTTDVVVVLDEPGTIRFQVATRDVGAVPEVEVLEVAGADNTLRPDMDAYFVAVRKVKGKKGGTP